AVGERRVDVGDLAVAPGDVQAVAGIRVSDEGDIAQLVDGRQVAEAREAAAGGGGERGQVVERRRERSILKPFQPESPTPAWCRRPAPFRRLLRAAPARADPAEDHGRPSGLGGRAVRDTSFPPDGRAPEAALRRDRLDPGEEFGFYPF